MISILISVLLNTLCFGVTYIMMPEISALEFLCLVILIPVIYNIVLFMKAKVIGNKPLTIVALTAITTISYVLFGVFTSMNGVMSAFAERNSFSDGNVTITVSENSNSMSNIMFVVLLQVCVMFCVKFMQEKREKNDTGR